MYKNRKILHYIPAISKRAVQPTTPEIGATVSDKTSIVPHTCTHKHTVSDYYHQMIENNLRHREYMKPDFLAKETPSKIQK